MTWSPGEWMTFSCGAVSRLTLKDLSSGAAYEQVWDGENRLAQVKKGATVQAAFVYDGDGARVKSTVAGVTTAYVGSHFEWAGSTSCLMADLVNPQGPTAVDLSSEGC